MHSVEGIARVVGVDGATAWLEPEQTGGCGSCASANSCGAGTSQGGIGTVANRIAARRFTLDNISDLHVGERVVVGVAERALVSAALTAYGLPLATALTAGGIADSYRGGDFATMAAMAGGLITGLLLARLVARRLSMRGELAPRFLRRAPVNPPPKSPCGDLPPGGQKHLGRPGVFPGETCGGSTT
ncbi:MAG: SoxR reducing system RseC family protein [Rhodocyclales bacterium]|nr:SoxR reducing system RseC family protein [Rhodocyclales bacterium]